MRIKLILLLTVVLIFITGCVTYSPEQLEKIIDSKCAEVQPFSFEKDGHNYTVNEIILCLRDKNEIN